MSASFLHLRDANSYKLFLVSTVQSSDSRKATLQQDRSDWPSYQIFTEICEPNYRRLFRNQIMARESGSLIRLTSPWDVTAVRYRSIHWIPSGRLWINCHTDEKYQGWGQIFCWFVTLSRVLEEGFCSCSLWKNNFWSVCFAFLTDRMWAERIAQDINTTCGKELSPSIRICGCTAILTLYKIVCSACFCIVDNASRACCCVKAGRLP